MAETIRVNEIPLSEVTVPAHDKEAATAMFERLMTGEIPVFVLTAAGVEFTDSEDKARTMLNTAKSVAEQATGNSFEAGVRFDITVNPGRGGDAALHADNPVSDEIQQYHVHTTTRGEVDASFANPGPRLGSSGINERYDSRLIKLFDAGLTDPGLMAPDVYTGRLAKGDTAVFRITGELPTFHKVETVGEDRTSVVTALSLADMSPHSVDNVPSDKLY